MNTPNPLVRYGDLDGAGVFVSGGASGIGEDIVRAFHAQGARVTFCDIAGETGAALAADLGDTVRFVRCDVTDPEAVQAAIDAGEDHAPLKAVVNNAGNDTRHSYRDVTPEIWRKVVDVNMTHQFFAAQRAAHHMRGRGAGSIVNFASIAPRLMLSNLPVYSACKEAAVGLTLSLARDLGAEGIRINAVLPGAIMTERQRQLWYPTQESVDAMVSQQCLQRVLSGNDVAQMVLFLSSDASSACTGQEFIVDGGFV